MGTLTWRESSFNFTAMSTTDFAISLEHLSVFTWKLCYVYFAIRLQSNKTFPSFNMLYHIIAIYYNWFLCFTVSVSSDRFFTNFRFSFQVLSAMFVFNLSDYTVEKSMLNAFITNLFKSKKMKMSKKWNDNENVSINCSDYAGVLNMPQCS